MSKPQISDAGTNGREDQHCSETAQAKNNADILKQSIRRFGEAFCELECHDRLSVILATMLGLALVLLLSPILLVSWICLLLTKRRILSKRTDLAFRSELP
jgi:hypothetical protein